MEDLSESRRPACSTCERWSEARSLAARLLAGVVVSGRHGARLPCAGASEITSQAVFAKAGPYRGDTLPAGVRCTWSQCRWPDGEHR